MLYTVAVGLCKDNVLFIAVCRYRKVIADHRKAIEDAKKATPVRCMHISQHCRASSKLSEWMPLFRGQCAKGVQLRPEKLASQGFSLIKISFTKYLTPPLPENPKTSNAGNLI